MSGRSPEWLWMTREWHLSELAHWTSLKETLKEVSLRCSTGKYYSNPGLLIKDLSALNSKVGEGYGLLREIEVTLEHNGNRLFGYRRHISCWLAWPHRHVASPTLPAILSHLT